MKKAIINVSFGCSIKEVRQKYIDPIEDLVKEVFDDIPCYRAFTSEIIRRKMKREENIDMDNVKGCLEKLKDCGYTHIYVLATHIIPGIEYEKILQAVENYKNEFEEIKVSRPFLDERMGKNEIEILKNYIKVNAKNDEAIVMIGHGTEHSSNKYYEKFENMLRSEINNIYISNIEGRPFISDIISQLENKKIKKVYLYPFLLVAGDHALNDITSDEADSIKSCIIKSGLDVQAFVTGLGSNKLMQKLFVNRLKECF